MRPCFKQVSGFAEVSFLIGGKSQAVQARSETQAQRSCLCHLSAVDLLLEGKSYLSRHSLANAAQRQVLQVAARTPSASAFGRRMLKHGRRPSIAFGRLGMNGNDSQKNNKVVSSSPTLTLLVAQCSAFRRLQYTYPLRVSENAVLMRTILTRN